MQAGSEEHTNVLAQVCALCEAGRYLDARLLLPALKDARSVDSLIWISRLYGYLGDRRKADALAFSTWRANRHSFAARIEMIQATFGRRGLHQAWTLLGQIQPGADIAEEDRADWLSLRGHVHARLKDKQRAFADHESACDLQPSSARLKVNYGHSLLQLDQIGLAVEQGRMALSLSDDHPGALELLAQCHLNAGEHDRALELLQRGLNASQRASTANMLHDILMDQNKFSEASEMMSLVEARLPLADKEVRVAMELRRLNIALAQHNAESAVHHAQRVGSSELEALIQRLTSRVGPQRTVQLPVTFIRQNHMTCAPATLASLARYWNREAEHLEIAQAICYDGTPAHSERRWCEEQGFVTAEFTVTWDAARALLDAGVPFTLVTVSTGSAHLQAVIGYDLLRGTLLIRDPSQPLHRSFDANSLFESHRSNGPRGMILLPPEEAHRLAGIELPETDLWNAFHRVMHLLSQHDRQQAIEEARSMAKSHGQHRLVHRALLAVAMYDGHDEAALVQLDQLLQAFPYEPNAALHKAELLRNLRGRADAAAWWEDVMSNSSFDPVLSMRFAQFLLEDTREEGASQGMLVRVLRANPTEGAAWHTLAGKLWNGTDRRKALDAYRIAACLNTFNESFAETYARAASAAGHAEEGHAFLESRAQDAATLSCAPAITLSKWLENWDRPQEALARLGNALDHHAQDPLLLLTMADTCRRNGRHEEGLAYLERARPIAKRSTWLHQRTAFHLDAQETGQALTLLEEALALEPLNIPMHRQMAGLLLRTKNKDAARTHLEQALERFPYHIELQRLTLAFMEDELDASVRLLHRMVKTNPIDAWIHRELAIKLVLQEQIEDAHTCAVKALQLNPHDTHSHAVLGFVQSKQQQWDEARQHLRKALELSIDNTYALAKLIDVSPTKEDRLAALRFICDELLERVTSGEALLVFHNLAAGTLPERDLLNTLESLQVRRPDLWQSWVACARQLSRMDRHADAHALLTIAISRFAMLPVLPLEQARVLVRMGDRMAARECCKVALKLTPGWPEAVRCFVDTILDENADFERALPVIDAGLRQYPDNADLRGLRAWIMWHCRQYAPAIQAMKDAIAVDSSIEWLWNALMRMAMDMKATHQVTDIAAALTLQQPGNVWAWVRLAEFSLDKFKAVEAIEHALKLEPRHAAVIESGMRIWLRAGCLNDIKRKLTELPWPPEQVPTDIAVYEARVNRTLCENEKALKVMRQLLARQPDNFNLWRELADWATADKDPEVMQQAANEMVRIAPQEMLAHAYVSDAWHRNGRPDKAAQAMTRALELEPGNGKLREKLTNLERELQTKALVNQAFESATDKKSTMRQRIEVMLASGRQNDFLDMTVQLLKRSEQITSELQETLQAAEASGLLSKVRTALTEMLSQKGDVGFALLNWLRYRSTTTRGSTLDEEIAAMLDRDTHHWMKQAMLIWLAGKGKPALDGFIRQQRDILTTTLVLWMATGRTLTSQGRYEDALAWWSHWQERPDLPVVVLNDLNLCLHKVGRTQDTLPVTRLALEIAPEDPVACTWGALRAFEASNQSLMEEMLARSRKSSLPPYHQLLTRVLNAYSTALRGKESALALKYLASICDDPLVDTQLRIVMDTCRGRLLAMATPIWARPWRWLQFQMRWY